MWVEEHQMYLNREERRAWKFGKWAKYVKSLQSTIDSKGKMKVKK